MASKATLIMTKQTPQPSIEEQQKLLNLYNQGIVHESIKSTEDFVSSFPNHVFGWKILSGLMLSLGRTHEALDAAIKAINIQPDDKNAISNLTTIYKELGLQYQKKYHLKEAESNYLKCLELNPNCSETHNYLGILYENQNKLQLAETYYRLSIKEKIDYVAAYSNLGGLLNSQKKLLEAEKVFLEALSYSPENRYIIGMLFYLRAQTCNWKNLKANSDFLWNCFQKSTEKVLVPTIFLSNQNFNLYHHYKIGREFAEINYCQQLPQPLVTEITYNHKKLRIGYLSADFHSHATVHLIIGVLENRNTELFDVYLYSYGVEAKDNYRSRVENACEFFHNVKTLSDEDIAQKIKMDEIDILIDLKGYTQDSRLRIQALRPAPIIINWLGYPATLGHERLADYIIGDSTVTPIEHTEHFSETLALMPHCYQPNDNKRPIGACPTHAEAGLPENTFVFATFNQSYKITPEMFEIWCRLLMAIPNSVLWILETINVAQDNLRREITIRGIDSSRLIFARKLEQTEHLGRLQLIDLAVDTFPCTSHTTASDALWSGVPLVTKMGETFASRVAASILNTMDLTELITTNNEDYFNVALNLALHPEKLAAVKHKITVQKNISPLFDTQKFAFDLEQLYQTIWMQELKGERKAVISNNKQIEKEKIKMTTNETEQPKRLNVGCGRNILEGWINLDVIPLDGVNVVADLDACAEIPLPIENDTIDDFLLSHVIEHIKSPLPLMQELWRVAKPNAQLMMQVPHGASDDAWEDPTHVRSYFTGSFGYFSQPFYWRADYGYRGDWRCDSITFVVPVRENQDLDANEILHKINTQRNVVCEMVARFTCIKPARETVKELQVAPKLNIHLR